MCRGMAGAERLVGDCAVLPVSGALSGGEWEWVGGGGLGVLHTYGRIGGVTGVRRQSGACVAVETVQYDDVRVPRTGDGRGCALCAARRGGGGGCSMPAKPSPAPKPRRLIHPSAPRARRFWGGLSRQTPQITSPPKVPQVSNHRKRSGNTPPHCPKAQAGAQKRTSTTALLCGTSALSVASVSSGPPAVHPCPNRVQRCAPTDHMRQHVTAQVVQDIVQAT